MTMNMPSGIPAFTFFPAAALLVLVFTVGCCSLGITLRQRMDDGRPES